MKAILLTIIVFSPFIADTQNNIIDSLQKVLQTQKEDTSRVKTLNALGSAFIGVNETIKSLEYSEQALALSEKLNYKTGQANALHNLGLLYGWKHDLPKAANYYEAAIKIREEINDIKGLAASYRSIGFVFMDMGNYTEALKLQFACLKANEALHDRQAIAGTYNNIGILYWQQKEYDEALKIYSKAVTIKRELHDEKGMHHPYNNMAGIYSDMGNYREAIKNYFLSLKIREEIGDKNLIADSYIGIGMVYYKMNNNAEALKKFNAALKLFTETGNKYGIADAYGGIGEINMALKKFTEARDFLNKELAFYKEAGLPRALCSIYEDLAKLDSATANYKSSLENYKMYVFYRDSMVNQENTKQFVQIQMQYDFDKKQDSINVEQDKKDALAVAQIENQKLIRNFSLSGAVAIVGFGGLSFYRYRRRRKLQGKQEMLNERLRISRELHDDIGSTLGSISIYSEVAKNRAHKNENANEAIAKIGVASRELIEKMSDIVWSINPNNESFAQLQNRMQAFAAMTLTPRNIQNDFIVDEGLKNIQLTTEERKNMFLIFKEALHNIVKYAECSNVEIKLSVETNQLRMEIKDDGKGFDPLAVTEGPGEVYNGNGLKNMQARADEIGALLNIHSGINEGSIISVTLSV